jgi:hypothetical protein
VSCGLPLSPNAGAFTVEISLNGQQFHDSDVVFNYVPVVYDLGPGDGGELPPLGPDTGGSLVVVSVFGMPAIREQFDNIVCRFGGVDTPGAGFGAEGTTDIHCIAPPLNVSALHGHDDDQGGLHDVILELSFDGGAHFSSADAETNACSCYGSGVVPGSVENAICVSTSDLDDMAGPLCWTETSNIFRYHRVIQDIALTAESPVSSPLAGGVEIILSGTGIIATDYQAWGLRCGLSTAGALEEELADLDTSAALLQPGKIACTIPESPLPRDVMVGVSLNGQQYSVDGPRFNYYDRTRPPTLVATRPESGPFQGATEITVTGGNIANVPTLSCRFTNLTLSPSVDIVQAAQFVSTDTATCTTPVTGMAFGALSVTVQLANDPGAGWSERTSRFVFTNTNAIQSTAIGPGLSGVKVAGTVNTIQLRAYDSTPSPQVFGGDAFYLAIVNAADPLIEFGSGREDLNNGQHIVSYNVTVSGAYDLLVLLGGVLVQSGAAENPVPLHPYSITVLPDATVGHKAVAKGAHLTEWYIWGSAPGNFTVTAKDRFGNDRTVGGDTLVVKISPVGEPDEGGHVMVQQTDLGDGSYLVTYTTRRAGTYEVQMLVNGDNAANSHTVLTVYPDVSHGLASFATIGGSGIAGDPLDVAITSMDTHGNIAKLGGAEYVVGYEVIAYTNDAPISGAVTKLVRLDQSVTDWGNGSYAILYTPTLAGTYKIEISLCTDELGAPALVTENGGAKCVRIGGVVWYNATIMAAEVYGGNTLAHGPAVNNGQSGRAFDFIIEARDLYNNRILNGGAVISASLFHTRFNKINLFEARAITANPCLDTDDAECVVVQDDGHGEYHMSYRVTLSGNYKVAVLINEMSVATIGHEQGADALGQSWFILDVDAAIAFAPYCEVTGEHVCEPTPECSGENIAGEITTMNIKAIDRFGNERTTGRDYLRLRFTPVVDWTGDLATSLTDRLFPEFDPAQSTNDNDSGEYIVFYQLTKTGDYLIFLEINNLTFPQSPFPYTIFPSVPFAATSRAAGPAFEAGMQAGSSNTFIVTSYDQYENLVPYGGQLMTAATQPLDDFGNHVVNAGPDEIEGGGGYDQLHDFTNGNGHVTPFEDFDFLNGEYEMTFTFYLKGNLRVHVFMNGDEIFGSPYTSSTEPGPLRVNNSILVGDSATHGVAGSPNGFVLQARDQFGNHLKSDGSVADGSVEDPLSTRTHFQVDVELDATTHTQASVSDFITAIPAAYDAEGRYDVLYNITVAGVYSVTAILDVDGVNEYVRDSPSQLIIEPAAASLQHSYADGSGVLGTSAGVTGEFSIVTVDIWTNKCIKGGDNIVAQVRGPWYIPGIDGVDLQNGVYSLNYLLELTGEYMIVVQLNDFEFHMSPISEVIVVPGPALASESIATGAGLVEVQVGDVGAVQMQARDEFGNARDAELGFFVVIFAHIATDQTAEFVLSVECLHIPPGKSECGAQDMALQGVYQIFNPAGDWIMHVTVFNEPIMNSPFAVLIREAPVSPAHCTVIGAGSTEFTVGNHGLVQVTSRDRFSNQQSYSVENAHEYDVSLQGPSTIFPSPMESLRDGRYELTWSTEAAGTYTLTVKLEETGVFGSPFDVSVRAGQPDLSLSTFSGDAFSQAVAGEASSYTMTTFDEFNNERSEALTGELTVFVLLDGELVSLTAVDGADGSVLITYTITVAGEHTLYTVLDGEQDISSAVQIVPAALDFTASTATGSGLRGSYAGSAATFDIHPADQFSNLIYDIDEDRISLEFDVGQELIEGPTRVPDTQFSWTYLPARFPSVIGSRTLTVTIDSVTIVDGGAVFEARAIGGSPYAVEIVTSAEKVRVSAQIPGSASDFDTNTAAGQASRLQFEMGVAAALGVSAGDVTVTDVSRRRLQSGSVTLNYEVESDTDLTSVFSGDLFAANLVASVNAAGNAMAPLSVDSLTLSEPLKISSYPTAPADCTAHGDTISENRADAGETSEFLVQLVNSFGVSQRASTDEVVTIDVIDDAGESNLESAATIVGEGSVVVQFSVLLKGSFQLVVKVDGTEITGSPFALTVRSGVAVAQNTYISQAVAGVLERTAGAEIQLDIHLLDIAGNREDFGRNLNASRLTLEYFCDASPATVTQLTVSTVQVDGGAQAISTLTLMEAGSFTLTPSLYGIPISGSPIAVVIAASDPVGANFVSSGSGLRVVQTLASGLRVGVEAGEYASFNVFARDAYLNDVPSSSIPACTGTSTAVQTCDLSADTDGTADCPAGCTDTEGDGSTCTGISTEVLTCDLNTDTDGTADCPAECATDIAHTMNWQPVPFITDARFGSACDMYNSRACCAQQQELLNSTHYSPTCHATITKILYAANCVAASAMSTCDLNADTDGTADCPAGCTGVAFSAATTCTGASTAVQTCDLSADTDDTADCPAGCTVVAFSAATTCTGASTAVQTCDLSADTDGTADCPSGCTGVAFSAATTCTGASTAVQTCDLSADTDGTADCPAGCTGVAFSAATTCTGASTAVRTCDLSADTDGTADCPAGCTDTEGDGSTCTGISTEVLTCDLNTDTDGIDACAEGCANDEIAADCTGTSTEVLACDLSVDTDGTDTCAKGCASDEIAADCTGAATEVLTCDLSADTDGTDACAEGCANDEIAADCTGISTEVLTCDLSADTDDTDACAKGCASDEIAADCTGTSTTVLTSEDGVCTDLCGQVVSDCSEAFGQDLAGMTCTHLPVLSSLHVTGSPCVALGDVSLQVVRPSMNLSHSLSSNHDTAAFEFQYRSQVAGSFILQLHYLDVSTPGSPYAIEVVAAAPEPRNFVIFGPGTAFVEAGQLAEFSIFVRDRFANPIAAADIGYMSSYLEGPKLIDVVLPTAESLFLASYTAYTAGEYTLIVDMGLVPEIGRNYLQTFNVTVSPGPASTSDTAIKSVAHTTTAGEFGEVILEVKDAFENIVDSDEIPWDISVELNLVTFVMDYEGSGRYVVTYNTTFAGTFLMDVAIATMVPGDLGVMVQIGSNALPRSPVVLTVMPSTTVDGKIVGLGNVVAGVASFFTVQGVDGYGNAAVYDPFNQELGFGASFNLTDPTEICHGGICSARQQTGDSGSFAPTRITNNLDNSFTVFFNMFKAGPYIAAVEYPPGSGHLTYQSPMTFFVDPAEPFAPVCVPSWVSTMYPGDIRELSVVAKDAFGNSVPVGGATTSVSMRITGDDINSPAQFEVLDDGRGRYKSNYTTDVAGSYSLFATLNGQPLQGSPFQILVVPGNVDPHSTEVIGFGLAGGYELLPISFRMYARDTFGNVAQSDPAVLYHVDVEVADISDWGRVKRRMVEAKIVVGTEMTASCAPGCQHLGDPSHAATGTYSVPESGLYDVIISVPRRVLGGKMDEIRDSPHTTIFLPFNDTLKAEANISVLSGDGLFRSVAGEEAVYIVVLRNRLGLAQPVGRDMGDLISASMTMVSPELGAHHIQPTVLPICCDDDGRVAVETNELYKNCTDALSMLQKSGVDCATDLGFTAPFRFLSDPCPALCQVCVRNCDSTADILYTPTKAGQYRVDVVLNGARVPTEQQITVFPGVPDSGTSYIESDILTVEAGGSYFATLFTLDAFNSTRPYTDEDLFLMGYATRTYTHLQMEWEGETLQMAVENEGGGHTKLSMAPTITGKYTIRANFNNSETRSVSGPSVMVRPTVPATGQCAFESPDTVVAGDLLVTVSAADEFGNQHTEGGFADKFKCLAFKMTAPGVITDEAVTTSNGDGTYTSRLRLTKVVVSPELDYDGNKQLGQYGVLCFYDEDPLSNIPLYVTVTPGPVSTEMTEVIGDGLLRARAGVEKTLQLITRDEYGNEVWSGTNVFMGTMRGIGMPQVSIDFLRTDDGFYTAKYTATASGQYAISIMRGGGIHVAGSPWNSLVILPSVIDPAECTFLEESLGPVLAGRNFTVDVLSKDQYGNVLSDGNDFVFSSAVPAGSFLGIDGAVTDKHDGTYTIRFAITASGPYNLHVFVSAVDIVASPLALTIVGGEVVPELSSVSLTGELIAGVERRIDIEAMDAYGNPTSRLGDNMLQIKSEETVISITEAAALGVFQVQLILTQAGPHVLDIVAHYVGVTIKEDVHFPGSPFQITVLPGDVDPARTELTTSTTEIVAGGAMFYSLKPHDQYDNLITNTDTAWFDQDPEGRGLSMFSILCRQVTMQGALQFITPCADASVTSAHTGWLVTVQETRISGDTPYRLEVMANGLLVAASPMHFTVVPGDVHGPSCTFEGQGAIGGVQGRDVTFTVTARDEYGNPRSAYGLQFAARVIAASGSVSFPTLVYDMDTYGHTESQMYAFYTLPSAGDHQLEVTFSGPHIAASPKTIAVLSSEGPSDPGSSIATGDGIHGTAAGEVVHFVVQARQASGADRFTGGDTLRVQWQLRASAVTPVREELPEFTTADNNDGSYTVEYRIDTASSYTLAVSLNDQPISGSPFDVEVIANSLFPAYSEYAADACLVGSPCNIQAIGKDLFNNSRFPDPIGGSDVASAMVQLVSDATVAPMSARIFVTGTGNGGVAAVTFIQFEPLVSGSYKVIAAWTLASLETLVDESATVDVAAGPTVNSKSIAVGPGLSGAVASEPSQFQIHARDVYNNPVGRGNDIWIVAVPTDAEADAAVIDNGDGIYGVTYSTTISGGHNLVVSRSGYDIGGSPYLIEVLPNVASPANCIVEGAGLQRTTPLVVSLVRVTIFDEYGNCRQNGLDNITLVATLTPHEDPIEESTGQVQHIPAQGEQKAHYSAQYNISTYYLTVGGSLEIIVAVNELRIAIPSARPTIVLANPPEVLSSQFTSLARSIIVSFDHPTNRARVFQASSCGTFFEVESTRTFGEGESCLWQSNSELLILLGTDATVDVDDYLMLRSDGEFEILVFLENSRKTTGGSRVAAPSDPVTPTVRVAASEAYSYCDEIVLDASATGGGAGRRINFNWGVQPNIPDYDAVSSLLLLEDNATVTIPAKLLSAGYTYTFYTRATNFFFRTGLLDTTIEISGLALPQLVVGDGSSEIHIKRNQPTFVTARAILSDCIPPELEEMMYVWSLPDGSRRFELDPRTKASQTLVIHRDTLAAGKTYELNLATQAVANASFAAQSTVTVVVDYLPVIAIIQGGDRTVSRRSTIVLDASESIDPDSLPVAFTYTWTCKVFADETQVDVPGAGAQCFLDVDGLLVQSSPTLSLAPGLLGVGLHKFGVSVMKEKGHGNVEADTTYVQLRVIAESVPSVSITASSHLGKINPSERLVLYAEIEEAMTLEQVKNRVKHELVWSSSSGGFNSSDDSLRGTSLTSPALVLLAGALSPGQSYRFELSANSLDPGGGVGMAAVDLTVNMKPSGGKFVVSPATGDYTTSFELSAAGWVDEDPPLMYEYRRQGGLEKEVPIGSFAPSSANKVFAYLPEGELSHNHVWNIVVRVYDAFGAFAENRKTVRVLPKVVSEDDFISTATGMLEKSVRAGNLAAVLAITDTTMKKVNKKGGLRRRLESHDLTQMRSDACTRLDATLAQVPVTQQSCATFANTLKDVVKEPFEMSLQVLSSPLSPSDGLIPSHSPCNCHTVVICR